MTRSLDVLLADSDHDRPAAAPDAEIMVAPGSSEEVGHILEYASENSLRVLVWGSGTHQGYGDPVQPDILLLTAGLDNVAAWEPDDLTVVVGAGATVGPLEERLAERGQTAVLPEFAPAATVGGVVSAGLSGWRRSRYGPTRDRILEVDLVTGDGRMVRAGGRVVKNVTGYDLPRLAVGSFGGLGVVTQVCLKLWPLPESTMTVDVDDGSRAAGAAYRPLAILEDDDGVRVFLSGTRAEVEGQASALGGRAEPGLQWPKPMTCPPGSAHWSLRIPPALLDDALTRVPARWSFLAQHEVGEVELVDEVADADRARRLRQWAEAEGGALVMVDAPDSVRAVMDPWGALPPLLETQRRIVARFDPARVVNPGRLPGGI